jgi:hypothetical protein
MRRRRGRQLRLSNFWRRSWDAIRKQQNSSQTPRCLRGWQGRSALVKRVKEDSAIVALKAKIGAILEAAEKSGTLNEDMTDRAS